MARNASLQRKNLSGFTLLEVLVSVAILSIIMSAVYSAYTTNVEAIQIARENGQVHQTARVVLDRMTKDLQSALTQTWASSGTTQLKFIGNIEERDGKRMDRLNFTTLTYLAFSERSPAADLCEVGYQVIEDPETEEILVLMRRQKLLVSLPAEDAGIGEGFAEGGSEQELARNLAGFRITYEDSRGDELDRWSTDETNASSGLPVLVKVRLVLKDILEREHVFTTAIHPELAGTMRKN
ncbi:MAG: prepilin-type N-terminal cleavage/methylation domain-containing protein [Deltaproteobacteria bacterium]|nr:prepilin-type N-terminal cleavage/methylation domain-containing protein [Deltaproteobacteria bacterium]